MSDTVALAEARAKYTLERVSSPSARAVYHLIANGQGGSYVAGEHATRRGAEYQLLQAQATYAVTYGGVDASIAYAVVEWVLLYGDADHGKNITRSNDPLGSIVNTALAVINAGRQEYLRGILA